MNNNESNIPMALWQRVRLDGRIYTQASEIRKSINIPVSGFANEDEFIAWYADNSENNQLDKDFENKIEIFIEKTKKYIPYKGIVPETSFKMMMFKFFLFNEIKEEYIKSIKDYGMGIKIVKDGKTYNKYEMEFLSGIEDSVYIKIKPFSTIDSIIKYIQKNKSLIRESLNKFADIKRLAKPKKIKISSHFKRDLLITQLNEYSKKQIEDFVGIKTSYKDKSICLLMKKMGINGITESIVKTVKQRRRIK